MSRNRRALVAWLVVGAAGLFIFPWYALPDTVLGVAWLRNWSGKESAPALLQVVRHGSVWLIQLVPLLMAGAVLLHPKLDRRMRANGLIVVGTAGIGYALLQGFAIGPAGWNHPVFAALFGTLAGRQYGMGFGAFLS
ncbi:MAG: iron ABC transporter permease, partial [Casimicrobiaceae bacterium]